MQLKHVALAQTNKINKGDNKYARYESRKWISITNESNAII